MWRVGLKFGLAASIVLVGWVLIEHELGFNTTNHQAGQYTRMIPAFVFYFFVYIAIKQRKLHQRNVLFFKHGFQSGALTTLIYSCISTAWIYVYAKMINPFFYSSLVEFEKKVLIEKGASVADTSAKLKEVEMTYGGSTVSYLLLFAFTLMVGLIVTLLVSYFLRTKKKDLAS